MDAFRETPRELGPQYFIERVSAPQAPLGSFLGSILGSISINTVFSSAVWTIRCRKEQSCYLLILQKSPLRLKTRQRNVSKPSYLCSQFHFHVYTYTCKIARYRLPAFERNITTTERELFKKKKTCKVYLWFEWVFVKDSLWLFREASF